MAVRSQPVLTRRAVRHPTWSTHQPNAVGPNRLWVADIAYVSTAPGFLYLAVMLDAWSRKVVGWSKANDLSAGLVPGALETLSVSAGPGR